MNGQGMNSKAFPLPIPLPFIPLPSFNFPSYA